MMGGIVFKGKKDKPKEENKIKTKAIEEHLRKAAPSEPSANYYLGQIYLRGYLGEVYEMCIRDRPPAVR